MELRVLRAYKVFGNGKHNAFTALTEFQGKRYLAFRSGSTHLAMDGVITVLCQQPNGSWQEVTRIALPMCDCRDPHFAVWAGKLHLYFFARQENRTECTSFVTTTADGTQFTPPTPLQGVSTIWGVAVHDRKIYATNYAMDAMQGVYVAALWASEDGIAFRKLFQFPFPGTEVAMDFDAQGSLWMLVRDSAGSDGAIPALCQLEPPFEKVAALGRRGFRRVATLPMSLEGPMLKRLGEQCVIAGRTYDPLRSCLRTEIFLWSWNNDLRKIATLPSGGDTSYAAWLDVAPGRALLSYYSAHEHRMALSFEEEAAPNHPMAEHCTAADVFVAELCYRA